jgi:hypothetical protein
MAALEDVQYGDVAQRIDVDAASDLAHQSERMGYDAAAGPPCSGCAKSALLARM